MSDTRDRCATCAVPLAERAAKSPTVRYCQEHWYAEQLRRYDAGDPIAEWLVDWFTRPRTPETRAKWWGVRA